jgi:hypothetical protein
VEIGRFVPSSCLLPRQCVPRGGRVEEPAPTPFE